MGRHVLIAVWVLALPHVLGYSHTSGLIVETTALPALSSPGKQQTGADGAWSCWYQGAPLHRLPVPTPQCVLRVATAGERLTAEAIEVSPFGTQWVRVRRRSAGDAGWIALAYCRRVAPENAVAGNLPVGRERVGTYDGVPFNYCPDDLVLLPADYCYNDIPQRLRSEAAEACRRMIEAARAEAGLQIKVLSAYRSARTQAFLCRQKIDADGFDQTQVARPGHSEHQLGTTVDIVGDNGLSLLNASFGSTAEGRWLRLNGRRFGFVQSYSRRRAVGESTPYEPWHFRYVGTENLRRFDDFWDATE